ncbi:MAG: hypothetical protein ACRDR6_07770 [Pseudonocardiaceae bacterium]
MIVADLLAEALSLTIALRRIMEPTPRRMFQNHNAVFQDTAGIPFFRRSSFRCQAASPLGLVDTDLRVGCTLVGWWAWI